MRLNLARVLVRFRPKWLKTLHQQEFPAASVLSALVTLFSDALLSWLQEAVSGCPEHP